ncbi:MAG: glutamate--tRNA ligase [bacterium]|nr:glutamate--tRNA ligase [bacterium]
MNNIRVRFAPSPTGHLHLGGARTALFNWLFARHVGGKFILRIEDTDVARSSEASAKEIIDAMKFLGLNWDEGPEVGGDYGPYYQFERKDIYAKFIDKLLCEEKAYFCFCKAEELQARREEAQKKGVPFVYDRRCLALSKEKKDELRKNGQTPAIRFKIPSGETSFIDLIRGEIKFKNEDLDDFVILKSNDQIPTYNFAVVIDDITMKITHVLRGDDHISNTPRQILLYHALNAALPQFGHLPMILGSDHTRLSKRHGATAVDEYAEKGYLPDALINFLARLGWSFDEKQEIFSREELIEKFSLERIGKNAAVFNTEKLIWLNGEYIKNAPLPERTKLVIPFLQKAGLLAKNEDRTEFLQKIVEIVGDRLKLLGDIVPYTDFFFKDRIEYSEDILKVLEKSKNGLTIIPDTKDALLQLEPFNLETIEKTIRDISEKHNVKPKETIQALRIILTGKTVTPGLFETIFLLGKDITRKRIEAFSSAFPNQKTIDIQLHND